jgi:CheY-like chemotaxis protein
VIALAPQEHRQIIDACRAAGIEHYTLKPVRRGSLVERVRAALGDEPMPTERAPSSEAPTQQPLLGLRVLLAEDNPINALLARTLLTKAGCVVTGAQDGEEAVAVAAAAAFDLILLDIRMPRLDGFEAAKRIRAGGGPSASAPMVALTADAGEEERAHAAKAGMDDFITKPIDANRLLQVAARFTERPNPATVSNE